MKRFLSRLRRPLCNERGEITFFACFFVVGVVMLISFLLLYASVRITCINIRNGAKMELNNLSATIYRKSLPLLKRNPLPAMRRPPAPATWAADNLQLNMDLKGRHWIVAAFLFSKRTERDVFETTSRPLMQPRPGVLSRPFHGICIRRQREH